MNYINSEGMIWSNWTDVSAWCAGLCSAHASNWFENFKSIYTIYLWVTAWKSDSSIPYMHTNFIFYSTNICASVFYTGCHICKCESTNKSRFRFSVCYSNGAKGFTFICVYPVIACLPGYRLYIASIPLVSSIELWYMIFPLLECISDTLAHKSLGVWYFIRWPMICTRSWYALHLCQHYIYQLLDPYTTILILTYTYTYLP